MSKEFEHDSKNQWFLILLEGAHDGFIEYEIVDGAFDMQHTFTPAELRGRGIAEKLTRYAFGWCLDHSIKVIPSCTYLRNFVNGVGSEFKKICVE
jgi:predicted GNAT family acetyltransferase